MNDDGARGLELDFGSEGPNRGVSGRRPSGPKDERIWSDRSSWNLDLLESESIYLTPQIRIFLPVVQTYLTYFSGAKSNNEVTRLQLENLNITEANYDIFYLHGPIVEDAADEELQVRFVWLSQTLSLRGTTCAFNL